LNTVIDKLYTYFGNKEKIADEIWKLFGHTNAYVEPFLGSGSVLLACPYDHQFEVINDYDCHISNVFRSETGKTRQSRFVNFGGSGGLGWVPSGIVTRNCI
jgi:D12 class N6 adenine-specific DNA methyltransferase